MRQSVRSILRPAVRLLLSMTLPRGAKTISAMTRIRNEEEFLEEAVLSIIDIFDEIILIDNLSDDKTPAIISALVQ